MPFLIGKDEIVSYQKATEASIKRGDNAYKYDKIGLGNVEIYGGRLGCVGNDEICVFIKDDNFELDTGWNDGEIYQKFAVFRKRDLQKLIEQAVSGEDKTAAGVIDAVKIFYLDNLYTYKEDAKEIKLSVVVRLTAGKPEVKLTDPESIWSD